MTIATMQTLFQLLAVCWVATDVLGAIIENGQYRQTSWWRVLIDRVILVAMLYIGGFFN